MGGDPGSSSLTPSSLHHLHYSPLHTATTVASTKAGLLSARRTAAAAAATSNKAAAVFDTEAESASQYCARLDVVSPVGAASCASGSSIAATSYDGLSAQDNEQLSSLGSLVSCPLCGKVFPSKYKLNRHYLIHTGEKPFQCQLCDFKCNQKVNLKNHILFKH